MTKFHIIQKNNNGKAIIFQEIAFLSKESLNYDTPESFASSFTPKSTLDVSNRYKYRFGRALIENPSLADLENDEYFLNNLDYELNGSKMRNLMDNGLDTIEIYRAVDKSIESIEIGDWVTIDKDYAMQHSEIIRFQFKEDPHILSMTVSKVDIITESYDINEFIYSPHLFRTIAKSLNSIWMSNASIERKERANKIDSEKILLIEKRRREEKALYRKYYITESTVLSELQLIWEKKDLLPAYVQLRELRKKVELSKNLSLKFKRSLIQEVVKYKRMMEKEGISYDLIKVIDEKYRRT